MSPPLGPERRLERLDYSLRRYYVDRFHLTQVVDLEPGSFVLDLGGVTVSKRGVFDIFEYDLAVVTANLIPAGAPDVRADVAALPFASGSFDAVICSEVLEHVSDPRVAVREIARVLRPGGVALISVPFLFRIHPDPNDYGRYTDQYWREVLATVGFDGIDLTKQGLFWSVLVEMLRAYAYNSASEGKLPTGLRRRAVERAIARGKRWAVYRDADSDRDGFEGSFTTGYGIRAVRS